MTPSILITACVGAPEYPGRSEHPVSQAVDIWSLGCVFSLAATWIILDYPGVGLFHKVRQRAIEKHIEVQGYQTMLHNQITTVSKGDQFHNGYEVLGAVTEWHKYLRTVIRKTDTITCRVLDLVDKMMLLGTPEHRIKADHLCLQLDPILKMSSQEERVQLPETLMTLLGEIDEEESIHAAESMRRSRFAQGDSSSSKTVTHGVRKSAFVERPLKTTHRQSIWPDQSLRIRDGKYPEHQGIKLQTVPEQAHFTSDTYPTPQSPKTHHGFPSEVSAQRPPTRSRRSGTAKKHPPQNYFQACEAVKKREHQRKVDIFRVFSKKDDLRDGLLMSYFRGKRDIVSSFWPSRVLSPAYGALSRSFLWTMPNRWKPIGTKQHNSSKCSLRKQKVSMKMVWTSVSLQETYLSTGRVRRMNLSGA